MSGRGSGPGAAVETAIDEFVAAWTAGERPDVDAFCRAHGESGPELKPYLEEFVSVRESLAGDDEPLLEGSAPRTLGDFRLLREIGRGGMGVVYEAEQISLRRPVAVKVLSGHRTLRPESIERFRREASTAARLEHPSIVRVFAVGEENGIHFFAMERVEGISLGDLLERRRQRGEPPENVGAVCRRVARIADALEFARRAGVVHRDVKPSNVLIRGDGTPVLTDFGLAREQGLPSVTRTGEFAGTPSYLSPEQAKGAAVDHRTDVYSLGVTLYECLTLRRPFEGESTAEILSDVLSKEPPSPRRHNRILPRDLETIVLKAIEKEPERRYATAGAFADDLRAFLDYRPIVARPAGAASRVGKLVRRHRSATVAVAAALLAVGLALGAWWKQPGVVELRSRPAGARVTLVTEDGREIAVTHPTPWNWSGGAGRYRARFELAGFETAWRDVEVRPGGKNVACEHEWPTGEIRFECDRSGVSVQVFRGEGTARALVRSVTLPIDGGLVLPAGTYWLHATLAEHERRDVAVRLDSGARASVALFLPELEQRLAAKLEGEARHLAVADLDGTGLEALVVGTTAGEVSALPWRGAPFFATKLESGVAGLAVTRRSDGETIVVAGCRSGEIQALAADGAARAVARLEGGVASLVAVDLDGDGLDEIVAGTDSGRFVALGQDGVVRAELRESGNVWALAAFDLDLDGRLDVVAASSGSWIAVADGAGVARVPVALPSLPMTVAAARIGADPRRSIVAGLQGGEIAVVDREGKSRVLDTLDGSVMCVAAADLDADGAEEVVARTVNGQVVAWGADGKARFSKRLDRGRPTLRVCDLDGDGSVELLTASAAGGVTALDAAGEVRFVLSGRPSPVALAAPDTDGDGRREVAVGTAAGDVAVWGADPWLRMGRATPFPPSRFHVVRSPGIAGGALLVATRTGGPYVVGGDGTIRQVLDGEVAPRDVSELREDPETGSIFATSSLRKSLRAYGADGSVLWEAPLAEFPSAIHLVRSPEDGAVRIGVGTWGGFYVFDADGTKLAQTRCAGLVSDLDRLDLDGDGEPEWIAAIYNLDKVQAFSDDGVERWRVEGLPKLRSLTALDVRGDGTPAIVLGHETGEIAILDAPRRDAWRPIARIAGNVYEIAAGDLDGRPGDEVLVCSWNGDVVAFALDGVKLFERKFPGPVDDVEIADLDGDGRNEIVASPNTRLNVAMWNPPRDDPRVADMSDLLAGLEAAERGDEATAASRLARGRQRWLALGPSSIGALQWRLRVCESPSARRVAAIADRSCQPTEIDAIDAIEALRAKERIASAMAILKSASLGRRWSGGSPVRLNGIARSIADPERPWVPGAPLAIAAAAAAVEATDRREPSYLDTFACAVFLAGRIDEAIATELEALGKIPPADEGALRPLLERSLARFRAATASSVASDR